MADYETNCARLEQAAETLRKASQALESAAKGLRSAAATGDHSKIRSVTAKCTEKGRVVADALREISAAWEFDDSGLQRYLESDFENELISVSRRSGIAIERLDDRLAAYPVIIQILPNSRCVTLDRKRLASIRPSTLAAQIKDKQSKPGSKPDQFIELLYRAYRSAAATSSAGAKLSDVYELLTLLPESRRHYSRAEFYRDVFELDKSNIRRTRSGATLTLAASTGTRGTGVFTVRPPGEMPKHYYGVTFKEPTA